MLSFISTVHLVATDYNVSFFFCAWQKMFTQAGLLSPVLYWLKDWWHFALCRGRKLWLCIHQRRGLSCMCMYVRAQCSVKMVRTFWYGVRYLYLCTQVMTMSMMMMMMMMTKTIMIMVCLWCSHHGTAIARVHPVHLMNVTQAQSGCQLLD